MPRVLSHRVESFLEATGMRLLGLGESLEPVGDLVEAFLAGGARHTGIHVGIFVRLAGDGRLQLVRSLADRQASPRVAALLEVFEMAVRVAGLAFGGRPEHGGDVVVAFDVGLLCEIEIAPVRLALAGKGRLQIVFSLGTFKGSHPTLLAARYGDKVDPSPTALLWVEGAAESSQFWNYSKLEAPSERS